MKFFKFRFDNSCLFIYHLFIYFIHQITIFILTCVQINIKRETIQNILSTKILATLPYILGAKYHRSTCWWFRIRDSGEKTEEARKAQLKRTNLQLPVSDSELLNGSGFRAWRSTKRLRIIEHPRPAASIRGSAKYCIRVSERGPPEGGSMMVSSAHHHRDGGGGEWKFEKQFR